MQPRPAPHSLPRIPDAPALLAERRSAIWISEEGEIERLSISAAAERAERTAPLVCHARQSALLLGLPTLRAYDLLELFAFARPAEFCLPTIRGLARAAGLETPRDREAEAAALPRIAALLLAKLVETPNPEQMARIAGAMGHAGWPWAPFVLSALGVAGSDKAGAAGFDVWTRLPDWSEFAPEPPPEDQPVSEIEARERLRALLGPEAERRTAQADYSAAAAGAFLPRDLAGEPNLVLAEAGTGTGKTLGYIAPASVWAEKNGGAVWLSTFTKNLQRQIDQELDRLYPAKAAKAERAVVRKGRENYLCLLNMEEALQGGAARPQDLQALGLMARWAEATRDGDMIGGDFPSWLIGLVGAPRTIGLADRRGECVYSACPHYRKCFIERSIRKARRAEIVIANHALVMLQAARAVDARDLPTRYVFDEAHHLFEAADNAFSAHLSGEEAQELRRWLRGAEGGRRTRARGLVRRIGDIAEQDSASERAMSELIEAARLLPGEGWLGRVERGQTEGPAEAFLAKVRQQVLARAKPDEQSYSLEAATNDPVPGLVEAARQLDEAMDGLTRPLRALNRALAERMDRDAAELDTQSRVRIEAAMRGLDWRLRMLEAWRLMLRQLGQSEPEEFVDWMSIERSDGRSLDIGLHRHWVDPTRPFAEVVLKPAHGAVITSATLRDRARDLEGTEGWHAAETRTGAHHLALPARRISVPSPFDYAGRTRVLVVTDVRRDNVEQVSAAYRELFLAAGGGALGLFTAIWRLKAVQKRLVEPMEAAGLPLLAQHVDPPDTSTLIDIFRAETDACLLGTDAVRDGVDVPGRSLRLIVFDRVPWPRPDILHRKRKAAFGGSAYDDMLVRLKLSQAFGRLLRRSEDAGVFVMLDSMLPTRLTAAFPPEVAIERVGLAEAVAATRDFLQAHG